MTHQIQEGRTEERARALNMRNRLLNAEAKLLVVEQTSSGYEAQLIEKEREAQELRHKLQVQFVVVCALQYASHHHRHHRHHRHHPLTMIVKERGKGCPRQKRVELSALIHHTRYNRQQSKPKERCSATSCAATPISTKSNASLTKLHAL